MVSSTISRLIKIKEITQTQTTMRLVSHFTIIKTNFEDKNFSKTNSWRQTKSNATIELISKIKLTTHEWMDGWFIRSFFGNLDWFRQHGFAQENVWWCDFVFVCVFVNVSNICFCLHKSQIMYIANEWIHYAKCTLNVDNNKVFHIKCKSSEDL